MKLTPLAAAATIFHLAFAGSNTTCQHKSTEITNQGVADRAEGLLLRTLLKTNLPSHIDSLLDERRLSTLFKGYGRTAAEDAGNDYDKVIRWIIEPETEYERELDITVTVPSGSEGVSIIITIPELDETIFFVPYTEFDGDHLFGHHVSELLYDYLKDSISPEGASVFSLIRESFEDVGVHIVGKKLKYIVELAEHLGLKEEFKGEKRYVLIRRSFMSDKVREYIDKAEVNAVAKLAPALFEGCLGVYDFLSAFKNVICPTELCFKSNEIQAEEVDTPLEDISTEDALPVFEELAQILASF